MQRNVAEIVAAYLKKNPISATELPELIREVFASLGTLGTTAEPPAMAAPAVAIRASIRPDHLVCLDCGLKSKMLKRHLMTAHDLTPDAYRVRWGLKADYPMVAPDYSKARSTLAVAAGLGRRRAKN